MQRRLAAPCRNVSESTDLLGLIVMTVQSPDLDILDDMEHGI